jgi:hypothetical protein
MIGAGGLRRKQQKHQIDRLAVERLKINRSFESCKQSEQLAELRQLAVRNGIAIPTPVEPSFSRCCKISRMVRSLWPESSAALAVSSCRSCFLLLTFSAGMMALDATRSVSNMDLFQKTGSSAGAAVAKAADHK